MIHAFQILIDGMQVYPPDLARMADSLHAKGWTLRPAAKELGVNFTHLHRVLRGERHSASLLRRVAALPRKSA